MGCLKMGNPFGLICCAIVSYRERATGTNTCLPIANLKIKQMRIFLLDIVVSFLYFGKKKGL